MKKNNPVLLFIRHGECLVNESGEKQGLTKEGKKQIQRQVKNVIERHDTTQKSAIIFHSSKERSIETANFFMEHFESRAKISQLSILSNSYAVKKMITYNWYLVPFIFLLLPWLRKLKAKLPPSPRSLSEVRETAGKLRFLINHLITCYQKKFLFDLLRWEEMFNKEPEEKADIYIFVGSEVGLQAASKEFIKSSTNSIKMLDSWRLKHGEIIEILNGTIKKY